MFLNLEGREASGIVKPGAEADALKARDHRQAERPASIGEKRRGRRSREVFDTARSTRAVSRERARTSSSATTPGIAFPGTAPRAWSRARSSGQRQAWSGDHCIDPRLVPGVLFCSRPIDDSDPALIDIAPTALAAVRHRAARVHGRASRCFDVACSRGVAQ